MYVPIKDLQILCRTNNYVKSRCLHKILLPTKILRMFNILICVVY